MTGVRTCHLVYLKWVHDYTVSSRRITVVVSVKNVFYSLRGQYINKHESDNDVKML